MSDQPQDPNQPPPPPPGQPPYGQAPYGQGQYGQGQYGQQPYGATASRGTNGMAIASLVTSFFCWPLGLIFGFIARNQIRQTGQDGAGLALAGIIISIVGAVFSVIWFAVVNNASNNNPYGMALLHLVG